jgi:hypothetical protein
VRRVSSFFQVFAKVHATLAWYGEGRDGCVGSRLHLIVIPRAFVDRQGAHGGRRQAPHGASRNEQLVRPFDNRITSAADSAAEAVEGLATANDAFCPARKGRRRRYVRLRKPAVGRCPWMSR